MTVTTYKFRVVTATGSGEVVVYESSDSYVSEESAIEMGWRLHDAMVKNHPEWWHSWIVLVTIKTQFTRIERGLHS